MTDLPINRQLQQTENIFLIFRGGEPNTDSPTAAPTPRPPGRDVNFRVCEAGSSAGVVSTEDVHFVYDVETNEVLSEKEEEAILEALETAMLDSVYESTCRRRLETTRRLEIQTISSGNRDRLKGGCVATSSESKMCSRYDGTIAVGFSEMGDNDSILEAGNTALQVVSGDMLENNYIEALNVALKSMDDESSATINNTTVTIISYVGTSFYDSTEGEVITGLRSSTWTAEEGGLSTTGKAFVPVLCLLFIGVIMALHASYRSYQGHRFNRNLTMLVSGDDGVYLDQEARSYISADLRDLAKEHSKQDVHRCNKTNCLACSQQPPPVDEVTMRRSPDESTFTQSVEILDSDAQSHSILSSITGTKSRGGWKLFGRQHSPTIQVVDEADDDEVNTFEERFEDEPQSVSFVKVDGGYYGDHVGVKRQVIDQSGYVRNEVEL